MGIGGFGVIHSAFGLRRRAGLGEKGSYTDPVRRRATLPGRRCSRRICDVDAMIWHLAVELEDGIASVLKQGEREWTASAAVATSTAS